MKVIRFSASLIFVVTAIIVVSALARTDGTRVAYESPITSPRVDAPQSNRKVVTATKLSAAKAQQSLAPASGAIAAPVDAAYEAHADENDIGLSGGRSLGTASRFAPVPAATLAFGILLLVVGGFLRRRRRTDAD